MKPRIILLVILVLLGLFLRLFRLDSRPLGFTWDEAALGYNAYSLSLTGRDEYAQAFPIVFKSFGDYKPGAYIYFTVPALKIFGLTEFATRLPSALFGTLLIIIVYLLTQALFGIKYSLFPAALVAINPWSIHFSHAAWEANIALVLTTLAALLFTRRQFILSAIFFGLTFWTYQGAKMFTPLLLLSLLWFLPHKPPLKKLLLSSGIILFFLLPLLLGLSTQSGRLKVFSVFSYHRSTETISKLLRQDGTDSKPLSYYLFHSEALDQLRGVVQRYLNHLSPRYLFIEGDWSNPRQAIPFMGFFLLPEILTFTIGLYVLIRSQSPGSKLILTWFLLAPLPSSLSRDIISAVRSLPMLVPIAIISGIGLFKLSQRKLLLLLFIPLVAFFFVYFLDLYFIHSPYYTASGWLYPYKPALDLVRKHQDDYSQVIFSDKLGQPYIFTLFYLRYDPRIYQLEANLTENPSGDVGHVKGFNKYKFIPIFWPSMRGMSSTLFIGDEYELSKSDLQSTPGLISVGEILSTDDRPTWRVVALP